MKAYKVDRITDLFRKYSKIKKVLTGEGGNKLFKYFANGVDLKQLSNAQKTEAEEYWHSLTGRKIDTRWHQLLYSKTGVFTPRYMPFEIYSDMISRQMPSQKVKSFFDDKCLYRYFLRDFTLPHRIAECCGGVCYLPQEGVTEVPFFRVVERCANLSNCIVKPSKGSSAGIGVRLLTTIDGVVQDENASLEEVLKSYNGNFVVERKLEESDNLFRLNPSSCNTLRIHTWRNSKNERCEFISAYIRIGREGSVKDNASAGGITCQIMVDGTLGSNACSVNPYKLFEKSDAGVVLSGYKIEGFNEMVDTAVKAHSCVPLFGIIGWDICMGRDGKPIIIEFNPDPDMRIEQLVFEDTCLLDKQEEIIKEIFDNN